MFDVRVRHRSELQDSVFKKLGGNTSGTFVKLMKKLSVFLSTRLLMLNLSCVIFLGTNQ